MVIGEGTYLVLFLFVRVENNFYNEKQLAQLGEHSTSEGSWVRAPQGALADPSPPALRGSAGFCVSTLMRGVFTPC